LEKSEDGRVMVCVIVPVRESPARFLRDSGVGFDELNYQGEHGFCLGAEKLDQKMLDCEACNAQSAHRPHMLCWAFLQESDFIFSEPTRQLSYIGH
jgi:hypothetical protein